MLASLEPPAWLARYYLWHAALGELHARAGAFERAREHLQRAISLAPTEAERSLLHRRLRACEVH